MKGLIILTVLVTIFAYTQASGEGFSDELNNLDFKSIIGAPLTAVIEAQATAAKTSSDFINDVGFMMVNGVKTVRMVGFTYQREDNNTLKNFTIQIPFILMMPVPYIEINDIEINFNVKLNSVDTAGSSSSFGYAASSGVDYNWGGGRVSYRAGVSAKSISQQSGTTQREYALSIRISAGQADLPKGTLRIFDMLENSIREINEEF